MAILEELRKKFLGRKYRCQKCGKEFRGNKSSCPSCGHTVFRPVD